VETVAAEVQPMVREDENRACFLRLIDEYGPSLRRLSSAYVERNADREDLFQEIAIALWQALPRFRGDSSERTWLYRIAHNVAITASAKVHRRSRRENDLPQAAPIPSPAPHAEQQLLQEEKRQLLERAIRNLHIVDREIVLLHLEGLSYSELEEISGLSKSALGAKLSRIRTKLEEEIQRKEHR
jgi:RNA polymerase sigma factor (sigma-70 family)